MRYVISCQFNGADNGLDALEHIVHDGLLTRPVIQVFADPDSGATSHLCRLAARVSRGEMERPDGAAGLPRTVVCLSTDALDDLTSGMAEAGADPHRVFVFWGMAGDGGMERNSTRLCDESEMLHALVRHVEAALIVVDPLEAFAEPRPDETRHDAIDGALAVLETIADRTGAAVVAIRHTRKRDALTE